MSRNVKAAIFIFMVISVALIIRAAILGKAGEATPAPSSLHDIVAAQLAESSFSQPFEFTVDNVHYFEDRAWIVAELRSVKENAADTDLVVMHRSGDSYSIAVGPGSIFPSATAKQLPDSVQKYLAKIKAIGR